MILKLHPHQQKIIKKCKVCETNLDFRNKLGFCKICYNSHRPKMSKEQKLAYIYGWRSKNLEKVRVASRKHYKKNRLPLLKKARENKLKRYGLSTEEYNAMAEHQNYRCAICEKHKDLNRNGYDLAVDHNHKTGKVRELLCSSCNMILGGFNDSEEVLLKALLYLKKHAS